MKTLYFISLVFPLLLTLSCKKETKPTSKSSTPGNTFTLKNNQLPFVASHTQIQAQLFDSTTLFLDASKSNQNGFSQGYFFSLPIELPVGTYSFEYLTDNYDFTFMHAKSDTIPIYFFPTGGSLEILQNDPATNLIEANFQFDMMQQDESATIQITDGHFQVTYLE